MFFKKTVFIVFMILTFVCRTSMHEERAKAKKMETFNFFGIRYDKNTGLTQCLPPETIDHIASYLDLKNMIRLLWTAKNITVLPSHLYPHIKENALKHALSDFYILQYSYKKKKSPYLKCTVVLNGIDKILNTEKEYNVSIEHRNFSLSEYYNFLYENEFGRLFQEYIPPFLHLANQASITINKGNHTIVIKRQKKKELDKNIKEESVSIVQNGQKRCIKYITYKGFDRKLILRLLRKPKNLKYDFFCMEGFGINFCTQLSNLENSDKIVQDYLKLFCNVIDYRGNFLIHNLMQEGDTRLDQIKYLIESCNMNPNMLSQYNKETPLHISVRYCQQNAVQYLIQKGALLDVMDGSGKTPLHYACQYNSNNLYGTDPYAILLKIAKKLILAGVDVNIKDKEGKTPLHYASLDGFISAVSLLVKNGAEVNSRDKHGYTPLDYAYKSKHPLIMQTLQNKGGSLQECCIL